MSLMNSFMIGASGTVAQSQRLNAVASNIANAESTTSSSGEAYRARQVVFRPTPGYGSVGAGVEVAAVAQSSAPLKKLFKLKSNETSPSSKFAPSNVTRDLNSQP